MLTHSAAEIREIKNFTEFQKVFFAKLMNKMIVVDEDVNVNEVAIYDVVTMKKKSRCSRQDFRGLDI